MASSAASPDDVTRQEFDALLDQYGPLLEALSASKGSKPGQKSLEELDRFRYHEAPRLFSKDHPERSMNHDDVRELVEWKLRHGKFRPTLMKLVSSNDSAFVEGTIEEGLEAYQGNDGLHAALKVLTKLKGIGPATASLLMAVHAPDEVPFFSDEAYYWLCNNGRSESLKYTTKEYEALVTKVQSLARKLDVSALDIEKVAYVLLKKPGLSPTIKSEDTKAPNSKGKPSTAGTPKSGPPTSTKRKSQVQDPAIDQGNLRRSKRGKAA